MKLNKQAQEFLVFDKLDDSVQKENDLLAYKKAVLKTFNLELSTIVDVSAAKSREEVSEFVRKDKSYQDIKDKYNFKLRFCGSIDTTLFPEKEGVDLAKKEVEKGISIQFDLDEFREHVSGSVQKEINKGHSTRFKESKRMVFLDEVLEQEEKDNKYFYDLTVNKMERLINAEIQKQEDLEIEKSSRNEDHLKIKAEILKKFRESTEKDKTNTQTTTNDFYKNITINPFKGLQQDDMGNWVESKYAKSLKKETEGIKHNQDKPQLSLLFKQFPKALEAVAKCSEYGHQKYGENDLDYLNFKRVEGGSKTYADAGLRHRTFAEKTTDIDSQLPHTWHVCWNALAELELILENN